MQMNNIVELAKLSMHFTMYEGRVQLFIRYIQ